MGTVAVLGCGPAGLMAAHAATQAGHDIQIWSLKQRSFIGGAQYLHIPVPGITPDMPDGQVDFIKWGQPGWYAQRVYGDGLAESSWDTFRPGLHDVWDMRAAYDVLWDRYLAYILDVELSAGQVHDIMTTFNYDKVFSSIPAKGLCLKPKDHVFESRAIWIVEGAGHCEEMSIIYNGLLPGKPGAPDWYRESDIFDHRSQEYSFEVDAGRRIFKPLYTNCDCWPNIIRVGRYGEWRKGVLISDAYIKAAKELSSEDAA